MESTTKNVTKENGGNTEKRINWPLKKSLLKIAKGESNHTFVFYFSEQNISVKVTFQKEGHFSLYDSQLETHVKRKVPASITGQIHWADEHTSRDLINAIIAWEEQRTIDSNSLKDHWINNYRIEFHPERLYGGLRFYIHSFNINNAIKSMNEAHKEEQLKSKLPKISFFP